MLKSFFCCLRSDRSGHEIAGPDAIPQADEFRHTLPPDDQPPPPYEPKNDTGAPTEDYGKSAGEEGAPHNSIAPAATVGKLPIRGRDTISFNDAVASHSHSNVQICVVTDDNCSALPLKTGQEASSSGQSAHLQSMDSQAGCSSRSFQDGVFKPDEFSIKSTCGQLVVEGHMSDEKLRRIIAALRPRSACPDARDRSVKVGNGQEEVLAAEHAVVDSVSADECVAVVSQCSSDNVRNRELAALLTKVRFFTGTQTIQLIDLYTSDGGRNRALTTVLAKIRFFAANQALKLIDLYTSDGGRNQALATIRFILKPVAADQAIQLIRLHTSDGGRNRALNAIVAKVGPLTSNQRRRLLQLYTSVSGRNEASNTLESIIVPEV